MNSGSMLKKSTSTAAGSIRRRHKTWWGEVDGANEAHTLAKNDIER